MAQFRKGIQRDGDKSDFITGLAEGNDFLEDVLRRPADNLPFPSRFDGIDPRFRFADPDRSDGKMDILRQFLFHGDPMVVSPDKRDVQAEPDEGDEILFVRVDLDDLVHGQPVLFGDFHQIGGDFRVVADRQLDPPRFIFCGGIRFLHDVLDPILHGFFRIFASDLLRIIIDGERRKGRDDLRYARQHPFVHFSRGVIHLSDRFP